MSNLRGETLRDIWEGKGLGPSEVAEQAGISVQTLYRMHRKEPNIQRKNIVRVCQVLGLTEKQYEQLEEGRRLRTATRGGSSLGRFAAP